MNPSKRIINLQFEEFDSSNELPEIERELLDRAKLTRGNAYAPYSGFHVGAAVILEGGEIISANNQENAAYPSGLCAERVVLFYAGSTHPNSVIKTMAIACKSNFYEVNEPISPCGACRQVIAETERRQSKKIRILMHGNSGKVIACDGVENLLPMMFKGEFLERNNKQQ